MRGKLAYPIVSSLLKLFNSSQNDSIYGLQMKYKTTLSYLKDEIENFRLFY